MAQGLAGPPASLKLLRGDIEARSSRETDWRNCDPHRGIYADLYDYILSDILPDTYSDIQSDIVSDILSDVLPAILSDILSDMYSGILFNILTDC